MAVLYITSDYSGVHKNLVEALIDHGEQINIYIPLNSSLAHRKYDIYEYKNAKFHISAVQSKLDRLFYKHRIRKLVRDIYLNHGIDWSKISMIHAATTCVEGAIAYELFKKTGIPYICAVRNTDINVYFKIFFWRRNFFKKILCNSTKIILISHAYYNRMRHFIPYKYFNRVLIIPNGINENFLNNKSKKKELSIKDEIHIVYAGEFSKNKNLIKLVQAICDVISKGYRIKLSLIGKGKRDDQSVVIHLEKFNREYSWLHIYEKMTPKEIIKFYSNSHVFAMVSHKETFGLVYIEALSQQLPIVYSKNEGIDGSFQDGLIGKNAYSHSIKDISDAIEYVINNYNLLQDNIYNMSLSQFSWKQVASKFSKLYKENI